MNIWRHSIILSGIALAILSVIVTACSIVPANVNNLAVGKLATVHNEVSFSPNGLHNFNGMKKSEILAVRSQAVREHEDLINGSYVPSEDVFGQIVDGRPWWGLEGVSFFDKGPNSSHGLAWHSQQICNPFILVVADVYSSSIRFDRVRFRNKEALAAGGCPSRCQPSQVSINPESSQGTVIYDVSQYIRNAKSFYNPPLELSDIGFSLQTCNARDFGYHYLYFDASKSSVTGNGYQKPVPLVQSFHCSNGCGISGGCNDMGPATVELENFKFAGLPARCHILLWKEEPIHGIGQPDFTFDVDFK